MQSDAYQDKNNNSLHFTDLLLGSELVEMDQDQDLGVAVDNTGKRLTLCAEAVRRAKSM